MAATQRSHQSLSPPTYSTIFSLFTTSFGDDNINEKRLMAT